jgi:hypothetical protein
MPTMAPTTLPPSDDGDDGSKKKIAIGVGVTAAVLVVGVIGVIAYRTLFKKPHAGYAGVEDDRVLV